MNQRTGEAPVGDSEQPDDVELLVRISDAARDPRDAELAFTAFFNRHAEFLRRACLRYRYSHSSCGGDDVVNLTMVAVYRGDAQFSPPATSDPDHLRRCLRAWLIAIARNQYYAQIRKLRFDGNVVAFDDNLDVPVTPETCHSDEDEPEASPPPALRTAILRFRNGLSPVDQLIFDRSLDYYDPALRQFNVPPQAARDISTEVGKSIAAVRKRRERMMTALREFVSAN